MRSFKRSVAASLAAVLLFGAPALGKALNLNVKDGVLRNGETPFVFVAYDTYGMLAEGAIPGIEQAFDINAFLDQVVAAGRGQKAITGVRIWLQFHWANAYFTFNGLPKTPTDTDRRQRYDFGLNVAYLDRLERFVAAANARNLAVQLCLFDGCALEKDSATRLRWENSPYNRVNNRDARALANPQDFFKTSGPLWAVNAGLVDAVVARVGKYKNLVWEIMNEPDVSATGASEDAVLGFHKAMATKLRSSLRIAGGSQVIAVNPGRKRLKDWALASSDVDLLSVHLSESVDVASWNFAQYLSKRPVVVSNDGHSSGFAEVGATTKARAASVLIRRVLAADGPKDEGRLHLEFLDNGMVKGYRTRDYDPRANKAGTAVMNALKTR